MNLKYRKTKGIFGDREIFEIHPIILGGSPKDIANKVVLTREQHIEAVRYWNKLIRKLHDKGVAHG